MGEVYRATDTKLGRDVALKVLPEAFARDADRMARFQREAQVLASLNHPNIAAIYGLEDSGGVRALVMELVEGPTLAERLKSGAVPLDDALPIAKQIADALEYAHERGIIHPRPETRECKDHARRRGESFGFRVGQSARSRGIRNQSCQLTHHQHRGDAGGNDSRHGGLHESGAGEREDRGPSHGHLGLWLRVLRNGGAKESI